MTLADLKRCGFHANLMILRYRYHNPIVCMFELRVDGFGDAVAFELV